jgi:ABC-type transporter MlaC component
MFFLEFRIVTISPSEQIESSAAQTIARLAMQRTTVQAPKKTLASLVRQRRNLDPCVDMQSISGHLFLSKSLRGHAATAENLIISHIF